MKLANIKVHNVLRVNDLDLSLEGHHLALVGGKNGQGKTSALTALLIALCGKRDYQWPEVVLQNGKDEGYIRVDLTGDDELHDLEGFTIELGFERKRSGEVRESFRLLDSAGDEAGSPRALLRELYKLRGFDPLAFEKAEPKKQLDLVRQLVGLNFDDLNKEREELYKQRRDLNVQIKPAIAEQNSIVYPEDTPNEPVSPQFIVNQMDDGKKTNEHIAAAKKCVDEHPETLQSIDDKIAKLQKQRAEEEGRMDRAKKFLDSESPVDIGELQLKLDDVVRVNEHVNRKKRKAAIGLQIAAVSAEIDRLTARMEDIDAEKQEAVEGAQWPMEGFTFDDEGLLLNGLPFEQASKAERVMASVAMGMAMNPKLRLFVCEDGNDLDSDTMLALQKLLEKNDFQMVVEFVTRSDQDEGQCIVVFEDGDPKPAPTPETAEA